PPDGTRIGTAQAPAAGTTCRRVSRRRRAVSPDAELELLASVFSLNEGPVWVPEGESGYLMIAGLIDNVMDGTCIRPAARRPSRARRRAAARRPRRARP